jgi:fibronectin-binding autotransporter adhesin
MSHPFLFRAIPQVAIGAIFASLASTAEAVSYYKANNASPPNLNNSGAWTDLAGAAVTTAPANASGSDPDLWHWDNRVTAANSVSMGGDVRLNTIKILDPGGPVAIDGITRTMSISNNGGIDMSAATQNLTIGNLASGTNTGFRILGSNYNIAINVAASRTFTLNSKLAVNGGSGGVTVTFAGAGTAIFNDQFQASHMVINAGEIRLNAAGGSTRNGTNTTNINGGRLVIANTSGSATGGGVVNVNNTGTLTGQGSMSGAVTVASGGTLIPKEDGVGAITTGGLTLAAGSTIKWQGVDTTTADLITVNNADGLTINGGTVELYNAASATPFTGTGVFKLFAYNGAIGGAGISSLAIAESSKIAGQTYTFGASAGFVTLTIEVGARPQSFWNVDNSGTWSTTGNWTSNGVPNAVSAIANLGGAEGTPITQPRTVTVGAPTTVGVLKFDSAQTFTVTGGSALTFDDGAVGAKVQVINGSHTITTPLMLSDNGLLTSVENAGSTLTLGGQIDGNGGLSKSGPGTLAITGEVYSLGITSVGAGTLQVGNGSTTGMIYGPVSNGGTLQYNRTDDIILNYSISGAGGVNFGGSGKTTLNVPNTFSGPTNITAGTVEIADGTALQNSTLNYASTGGVVTFPEFLTSVTLGGLTGDRSLPLTNALGDPVSLTVGQNNSTNGYAPSTTGTGGTFTKLGSGIFTLTGTHAFNGAATVSAGTLSLDTGADFTAASVSTVAATAKLRLNGGTLHVTGAGTFENASTGFELNSGTANINGAVTHTANISSGNVFVNVNGGTLNAGSVSLSRCNFNLGTAEPANGSTTNGLYVHNNGIVNVAGNVLLGNNANSSVSGRIETGGSLTVNGTTTVAIDSPDRWSILDVAAGTFTSTHVAGGVFLGGATAGTNSRGQAIIHVRGTGVAKAERIQFGQAALGGQSILRLSGGELYVGSGGMVIGSSNPALVSQLRLEAGILGALGDSTSDVPVNLNGPAVVTGAGTADEPHSMTLTGATTGTGSLTKNGAGTVIFSSQSNNFSGPTTVNAGTLGLGGLTGGLITVNTGTTLAPQGVLAANGGAVIDGTLSLAYDSLTSPRVPRVTSTSGAITLGASSTLAFSGSGTVTGSVHVILKSTGGVTGTFGTVTGIPADFTLNYAYDDDGNAGTPPVVAIINPTAVTPFSSWIQTYVGNGSIPANQAGLTQDPDGDGVDNGTEFAFDGDPGDGSNNGKIFGLTEDGEDVDVLKQLLLTVAVRTGTSFTAGAPATGISPDGITYSIGGGTSLSAFTTGVALETTVLPPPNAPSLSSGWEWLTFSLTGSNGLTGKGFLRAQATTEP